MIFTGGGVNNRHVDVSHTPPVGEGGGVNNYSYGRESGSSRGFFTAVKNRSSVSEKELIFAPKNEVKNEVKKRVWK